MALILTGGLDDSDDMSDTLQQSKMVKSTWIKLVYKLSQNPRLSQFERLIYTYLSGGDISGNLEIASASYDEYMNVLINQLLVYQYLKMRSTNQLIIFTYRLHKQNLQRMS